MQVDSRSQLQQQQQQQQQQSSQISEPNNPLKYRSRRDSLPKTPYTRPVTHQRALNTTLLLNTSNSGGSGSSTSSMVSAVVVNGNHNNPSSLQHPQRQISNVNPSGVVPVDNGNNNNSNMHKALPQTPSHIQNPMHQHITNLPQVQQPLMHHPHQLANNANGGSFGASSANGGQLINHIPGNHQIPPPFQPLQWANAPSYNNFQADITQIPGAGYYAPAVVYQYPLHTGGLVGVPGMGTYLPRSNLAPPMSSQNLHFDSSPQNMGNRKEWFDYLLHLAHQKYNAHDYASALSILQDLFTLNQAHLPTLLLLGCTCYSLGLHNMSVYYNNLILGIDPQFAEAYSNLGTTHRAMSQVQQNSKTKQPEEFANPNAPPQLAGKSHIECAEYYYKLAISIRPKYWDASINLAGLLSSQGRWKEAISVYEEIETLMEEDFPAKEKLCQLPVKELDIDTINIVTDIESRRRNRELYEQKFNNNNSDPNSFTIERRRDLYFAKGNLQYAMNRVDLAKQEYFKGLAAVGLEVASIFQNSVSGQMPAATLTPQRAYALYQQKHSKASNDPVSHPTTSSILQTLAKIYQDSSNSGFAVSFYYLALSIYPTANTCNNLGILLASNRLAESIQWYEFGLVLDSSHVHLYTNLGSALKDRGQVNEGIHCYQRAIAIQPDFFIALANLANVYKDLGRVEEAIDLYARGLKIKPDFVEAFCNYVNSLLFICDWDNRDENLAKIRQIVEKQLTDGAKLYPKTVPTVLPFHTFTYATLSSWMVREISSRNADRVTWNVLCSDWFPGFPQRPAQLLAASNNDASLIPKSKLERSLNYPFPYPVPSTPSNCIKVGYVSSDFNNHPLAHLMQSVFGIHDRSKFQVYCYSLSPSDNSPYREKIESEADFFLDVSSWSLKEIVERIAVTDQIHILCNLNGYTKGGRNEIFAARAAPIQMSFMGYAGTMGAGRINDPNNDAVDGVLQTKGAAASSDLEYFDNMDKRWIDYMVVDEIACPRKLVCGEPLGQDEVDKENAAQALVCEQGRAGPVSAENDQNRVYTEGIIYMPQSYFVNDHRQGFREQEDSEIDYMVHNANFSQPVCAEEKYLTGVERLNWRREEIRRLKMRRELFPDISEDTVIFANFNQLYKIDPDIFATWMNIIKRVPNSILWLLRFPPAGEKNLRRRAVELVGEEVAKRLVFTAVASKHIHIHRGRVADIFLDTPECNAHTTAADILWSGTPVVTYPKYEFKMCSRVAASVAYATGTWDERDEKNYMSSDTPRGLNMDLERLKDPNLLGHYMVVNSYTEYEDRAVSLGSGITWEWKRISSYNVGLQPVSFQTENGTAASPPSPFYPATSTTHLYVPQGKAVDLRRRLFLTRDSMSLFDTNRWVRNLEQGMLLAYEKFDRELGRARQRNRVELGLDKAESNFSNNSYNGKCFWIKE